MPKITSIKTALARLELKGDFHVSRAVMKKEQLRVFVLVEDEQGNTGLGEAAPLSFFNGETPSSSKVIIDNVLAPAVMGEEVSQLNRVTALLNGAIPFNHTAKTALETALWDLAGKALKLPAYNLLGGLFRQEVRMAHVLSLKDLDLMVAEAAGAVEAGYRTLKVKLTGCVETDVEMIKQIRESVGNEVSLRADANAAYRVKDALRAVELLAPYRLQYLEQPCAAHNLQGLKEIRDRSDFPIAADESLLSLTDGLELIRNRIVDHLVIKLIKVGGILNGLKIADLAAAAGIGCTVVSPIETSIGAAAGITLALIARAAGVDQELNGPDYLVSDPASGLVHEGNIYYPPEKPGLGVTLQQELFAG